MFLMTTKLMLIFQICVPQYNTTYKTHLISGYMLKTKMTDVDVKNLEHAKLILYKCFNKQLKIQIMLYHIKDWD